MTRCLIVDRDGVERCTCDVSDVFSLLANDRRRTVIAALERAQDDWISVDRLLTDVSSVDDGVGGETWAIELHHVHVPLLEEKGLIEYDAHGETIRYYHCELVSNVLTAIEATASGRELTDV
ncbi:DUF7344 domain-containing protein [Natrarchaeobius chitinivorans]|uniref:ArsR family transcriptional regulator n=1 Tax=Natrarchaeobius chitinivorans TaxID=1679083 RepID=A0A3N6MIL3_NATCH|nr:ArsR family transcriptional regulator [Natrarchaeobius chitinivorans]RQG95521.1 ArsR family transcriptional regulator [Natrarchaeobius chitinivorans]